MLGIVRHGGMAGFEPIEVQELHVSPVLIERISDHLLTADQRLRLQIGASALTFFRDRVTLASTGCREDTAASNVVKDAIARSSFVML